MQEAVAGGLGRDQPRLFPPPRPRGDGNSRAAGTMRPPEAVQAGARRLEVRMLHAGSRGPDVVRKGDVLCCGRFGLAWWPASPGGSRSCFAACRRGCPARGDGRQTQGDHSLRLRLEVRRRAAAAAWWARASFKKLGPRPAAEVPHPRGDGRHPRFLVANTSTASPRTRPWRR